MSRLSTPLTPTVVDDIKIPKFFSCTTSYLFFRKPVRSCAQTISFFFPLLILTQSGNYMYLAH
jgi:hypothetical protein